MIKKIINKEINYMMLDYFIYAC